MRFVLPILWLVCLFSTGCVKKAPDFQLIDHGIYDATVVTKGNWALGIPLEIVSTHDVKHREQTEVIPAKDGVYWGFRAKLENNTTKSINIRVETHHPTFTTPDGKTSENDIEEYVLNPDEYLGEEYFWFFMDATSFEYVPGHWTWKIFANEKEIFTKTFHVQKGDTI